VFGARPRSCAVFMLFRRWYVLAISVVGLILTGAIWSRSCSVFDSVFVFDVRFSVPIWCSVRCSARRSEHRRCSVQGVVRIGVVRTSLCSGSVH
jgi:hypothetical protein